MRKWPLWEGVAFSEKRREDLSQVKELLLRLGVFEGNRLPFSTIHVAGTNGKGSVSHWIAQGLRQKRSPLQKVGLFTSPHVFAFNERIQMNDQLISDQSLASLAPEVIEAAQGLSVHPFDLTFALAALYFARERVEVAVLEAGLGGRLDATNVCQPDLAIITQIALDHQGILGESIEEIAQEKAGIAKKGVPLLLGVSAQGLGVEAIAEATGSPLLLVEGSFDQVEDENRACAKRALLQLGYVDVELGPSPWGRFMTFKEGARDWVLDIAHNPSALRQQLSRMCEERGSFSLACGFQADKRHRDCLRELQGLSLKSLHFLEGFEGAFSAKELTKIADELGLSVESSGHYLKWLERSWEGPVLICGSVPLVASVYKAYKNLELNHV